MLIILLILSNLVQLFILQFNFGMSHLRDLQKLRNTKNTFQIKKNSNVNQTGQLRLGNIQPHRTKPYNNHQQEPLIIPEIMSRNFQLDNERDAGDSYSKYLQSKEIFTARESKERPLPKTGEKLKHRRGNSFGIGSTYYDTKSKDLPQSGLSVYNFQMSMGNTQGSGYTAPVPRKSNPLTSRRQKVPELFVNQQSEKKQSKQLKIRKQSKLSELKDDVPMKKNAFQILYPIGKGGFGKVWKVRCKRTGQIFAMKEMQKAKVINKKSINSVMNERTLLAGLYHPFLVNMKSSFQDRQNIYLVMDYLNGGDLRYHIGCKCKFNQNQTKFFIGNIIIGLEYLHERKIIHRDLKPQNFVLDSDGYLRITDLGVSRIVRDDNHQDTSGTPGYMAPQVICHKNHTFAADYFALGVMGYQFMLGRRPYNGRNRKEIRQSILTKQAQVKIDELPYRWSPKAADFINQLLQRNPEKRLGWNGIQQLKNHPWMADLDWKGMRQKSLKSPFVPLTIEENYDDYKEQISEDTIDQNAEETRIMLRDPEVQELFKGYQFSGRKQKHSLRTTNYTDYQYLSLRGSGK